MSNATVACTKPRLTVYEYVVVNEPKDEKTPESIIKGPVVVLAGTKETAQHIAISDLDPKWKYAIAAGEVKVHVRPFS